MLYLSRFFLLMQEECLRWLKEWRRDVNQKQRSIDYQDWIVGRMWKRVGVCRSVINGLEERLSHSIGNKTDASTPLIRRLSSISRFHSTSRDNRSTLRFHRLIPTYNCKMARGKFWKWNSKLDFRTEVEKEIEFLMRIFQQSNKIEAIGIKAFNRLTFWSISNIFIFQFQFCISMIDYFFPF